ncbi:Eukaryotic translation initiation factor isoform 4G-2 [Symbiodinium microadriaticum]|uniref:Eukaryotic translation initiation factor isoform 4G-2 n=1 Tax=Symbiodinium microadriaticum TaxID=2951 RepID=A0A1Q9E9W6_SYMMI|nr:Eukaryotic translation initiation factor isoform 4G-2 [Symbiodinium microadriaticum]
MPTPAIRGAGSNRPVTGDPEEEYLEASEFRSIAIEVPGCHIQEVEEGLQRLRQQFEAEIQSITARLGTVEKQLAFSEIPNPNFQDASPNRSAEKVGSVKTEGRSTLVHFEESAWNIPLVLGLADVGWFDNVFAVLLVLLNLLMQGSFSQILLSEYFMGEPFETNLQSAKTWRTSIAHDSRYLDLAGTSLVSRVCAGDGSLILSTVQATLVQQINDFLGLQTGGFEFNLFQPGTLLCLLCILLWSLCVYKASTTDFRDNTIHSLSWGRALALLITYIVRAGIASVLLVAGILWLARTTSIEELMLNSVALNAILDVDEFLFEGMTPIKIQHAIRSVEPIKVSYSHRRSQMESMVHFLAVVVTVLASYLFLLVPLCDTMMAVKRELCDGQTDFVVAYSTDTQISWGLFTEDLETVQNSYEISPIERSVMSQKGTPSSLEKTWPQTIWFNPDRRSFDTDVDRSISSLGNVFPFCMETTVLLETGDLHGDPALQPIIENVLRNAASALGRPDATTCAELADLCSMSDARLLRVVCGEYKVEHMGCATRCLAEAEAKLPSVSCEVINDAGWQAFWHQYDDALIGYYGEGVTQTQFFGLINSTVQAFLTNGCPVMETIPTELLTGVSWCDGQPELFRPLASMHFGELRSDAFQQSYANVDKEHHRLPDMGPTIVIFIACTVYTLEPDITRSDRRQSALNMVLYEQLREDCGVTMIFCVHPDRTFASAARSTRIRDLKSSARTVQAVSCAGSSTLQETRLSKKLPDMFANPSTLSSFAQEFQPSGAAPVQPMQNPYYSSPGKYCQYRGQEQMQQGTMGGYYTNTGYGYDCYQNVAYPSAAFTGDGYNQGYYGNGQYTNANLGHYSKSTYNRENRNPRAAAINLDDFSDISDSDSDADIPSKLTSPEKKVPDALETSSDTSEDAEPAEEPSPCAAAEAPGLLEDATSDTEPSLSSTSSEPEAEELGPMSEVDSEPETVFSLKQMLMWRAAVLKSEKPHRTQVVEEKTPVMEPVPVTKTPKGKAKAQAQVSKSKAGKLEVSENSWTAQQRKLKSEVSHVDGCEQVARTIKSILNKLTLEKFASLSQQLLQCGLRTSTHVEVLIHEVFEKATTQHHFIDMYADLCVLLHEHFTAHPFENCSGGKADGRKMTFKRLLLDECQLSFERLLSPPEGLELLEAEERTAAEVRYKTSMLGNIRLVAGLLSRGMLACRVGIAILEELLSNPTPEALESIAAMLTVLGPTADNKDWPQYKALNAVFDQISTIVKAKKCPARERFLLKDLLDLRSARWVDKRPKKIERAMTLAQVADSAAGRRVEERLIRKVASTPAPVTAFPAYDQEKFREGTKKALVELRHSGCLEEAVKRMKAEALGVPPEKDQAAEVSEILCFAVQEAASSVRELDLKALRLVAESWKKDVLAQGAGLFVKDIAPDLACDVPGLSKIMSEEVCVLLPEAADAVNIFLG